MSRLIPDIQFVAILESRREEIVDRHAVRRESADRNERGCDLVPRRRTDLRGGVPHDVDALDLGESLIGRDGRPPFATAGALEWGAEELGIRI